MPTNPNKLSQFWQELKRRKVIKVVAMYAATAFIILEVVDIVAPSLGLPDWTLNLVIVLLSVGFPITIILSWVFDVTPEGIKKTESIEDRSEQDSPSLPIKRRLKVSDVIIVVLFVVVVVLAYPRIFKGGGNLKAMTTQVIIQDENGVDIERLVFKEEYVHKLMILPFEAEDTDTVNAWLKYGILKGILEDLRQFNYLLPYVNTDAIHLQEQITAARINNCTNFLTGTYKFADDQYIITCRLHQTRNGLVETERIYKGNDLFSLLDSISIQTRIDLGISTDILSLFPDLPVQEYTTGNLDAYRYFIQGLYSRKLSAGGRYRNLIKALALDSTFALASYSYAFHCHYYQQSKYNAHKYISHAMRHRQRLPEYYDTQIRIYNYLIFGELEKAIGLSEWQYELQPYNIELLLTLINDVYNTNLLDAKAENAIKKLIKLVPDYPVYQIMLAKNYLLSGKLEEGLKYTQERIEEYPENKRFHTLKGQFLLHKGDLDNAEKVFRKAILVSPEDEHRWSLMLDHINFSRNRALTTRDLEEFTGRYRSDEDELIYETVIHKDHLISKPANQEVSITYPLSDTSYVNYEELIFFTGNLYSNEQGKTYKVIEKMSNYQYLYTFWIQDPLIVSGEKLLESNHHQEALIAFKKAYSENPEHYYLANYIKHLKFILSPEYEDLKPHLESCIGEYGAGKIFKENDCFFIEHPSMNVYKLLPLSEDQFMNPSKYYYILKIIKENNEIRGLKAISTDGREYFYERTSEQALAGQNQ